MNICITVSPNYWLDYVAVEMYSLFKTNPAPIKVYIISDELPQEQLNKFDKVCKICGEGYTYEYINALPLYDKLMSNNKNVDNRFTRYTLYRLLIPYLINEDKLLYVDADAAIVGNIEKFYNKNFNDNLLIGVVDSGINNEYKQRYGLSLEDNYCNAGILLWNLKEIKKLNLVENWIKDINDIAFPNHDQDELMISCKGRVDTVGIEYNTSLSTGLQIEEKDICIMHWAGIKYSGKEWVKDLPFPQLWNKWQSQYDKEVANKTRIPKIIHYVWLSKRPKPLIVQKYIQSWRDKMPDYKIVEWNENNIDLDSCPYLREAYDKKLYAFCTDYIRLKVLYEYGGIYCDADVEALQPFDKFLEHRCFTGHEADEFLVTAVLGSEPHHPWIKMLLDYYKDAKLDNIPNTHTITNMSQSWIEKEENGFTFLKYGVIIYPTVAFCNYDHKNLKPLPTKDSYALHHFAGTWINRVKVQDKPYKIDLDDIFYDNINWQMSYSEKTSVIYLIEKLKNKNVALEIGSYQGGTTRLLSKYFNKVYSCDINHDNIVDKHSYKNVEWITGDSKNTLPVLINKINQDVEDVNFILIDADHSFTSVLNDINNVLKIKPKNDLILLIHDSWFIDSRLAICNIDWNSSPYVHYINTDWCTGDLIYQNNKNIFVGGLCLVILSPEHRNGNVEIQQSQDFLYCKVNQLADNEF